MVLSTCVCCDKPQTKAWQGREVLGVDPSDPTVDATTGKMTKAVELDFVIKVTQDDPEILTKVFARTVEYMDDEDEFYEMAHKVMKGIVSDQVSARYAKPKEEPQGLSESHVVMNSWRKFLNG